MAAKLNTKNKIRFSAQRLSDGRGAVFITESLGQHVMSASTYEAAQSLCRLMNDVVAVEGTPEQRVWAVATALGVSVSIRDAN